MDDTLPNEYEIIVIGTGLSESILSGALSRIGKKVLHLDHNKHYGSSWSSFNLKTFESWIGNTDDVFIDTRLHDEARSNLAENESFVPVKSVRKTAEQGCTSCFLPEKIQEVETTETCNSKGEDEKAVVENVHEDSSKQVSDTEIKTEHSSPDVEKTETLPIPSSTEGGQEPIKKQKDDTETKKQEESGDREKDAGVKKLDTKPDIYTSDAIYSSWRHFNLDLAPKLMFSRGKLVELLITSNVCRYLEFRNVSRTLTLLNDGSGTSKIAPVPCSRTDVFTSKFVTMIEKRMLMRVLTMCANYENHPEEYKEFENGRFVDFLAAKKLSKKLQHFILHSISMVTEDTSTLEGLKATQKFLRSLGRYGNSAFLWPLYGVGELPQAFCRLSAVFGGTFCLSRSLAGLIINKETGKCVGIIDTEGQRLDCEHLILDECYVPEAHRVRFSNVVSRAIYVTDSSVLPAENENVSLITIPPAEDLPSSRLIEVGPSCCVCPRKHYVVHAMTSAKTTEHTDSLPMPQSQFANIEKILFKVVGPVGKTSNETGSEKEDKEARDDEASKETAAEENNKPQVMWAAYFNMMSGGVDTNSVPENVHVTRGPSMDLGFDETVLEAKRLFETICPDEEFLPRAPNPDEIVYFDQDDEGYNTEGNGGGSTNPSPEDEGDYQEDESEVDAGSGEPEEQEAESMDNEDATPSQSEGTDATDT